MRGQVTSFFLLTFNLVGFGFGPTLVALLTQYVFHSEALVGRAMASAALLLGPLGACVWAFARKPYARCVVRAKAWS